MENDTCEMLDLGCHLNTLGDKLLEFFQWVWQLVIDAVVAVLSAIPVPDWMSTGSFQLPGEVLWFASVLELQYGLGVMSAAWTIRFLIRRIPVIG